ncbi:MAG: hypothetical protein Q7U84_07325, partial [Polynucleobacter sp.]|nr:hypothetical protein [Polynucleobacter sp.]
QEKAAYDYAHNLKLPDSVPKPVPFNFTLARIKALWPSNPSVSDQYFEHLCKTEAGEYIFRMVENVEGMYQMRPSVDLASKPIDFDRYALEAPIIMGADDDGNIASLNEKGVLRPYKSGVYFVQPMYGKYLFLEQTKPGDPGTVVRQVRRINEHPPAGDQNGYSTSVPGTASIFRLPFMVVIEEDKHRQSKYGFTWRGIKRELDRKYSIGGGEYLMVDMQANEVLGIKRNFVQSGHDQNSESHIWWGNARSCKKGGWTPRQSVEKVLKPIPRLNDQYIP